MIRRIVPFIVSAAAVLAVATPAFAAPAAFFPADAVDGPSAAILAVGDVDVSRDGSGAVVYTKLDGGAAHVFASRLVNGAWQPAERIDAGIAAPASQPVIAASDGGRLVVAFVAGGQLFTVVRPTGANAWPAPVAGPPGANPSLDMSINGAAYLVWSAAGDVRAARLDRKAVVFAPLPSPLDIDPAAIAGEGSGRARVAIAADGTATAVWGESGHVFARRLFDLRTSTAPQQVDVAAFKGLAGGAADAPDLDTEDDSSYAWVAFRQVFADGRTHVIARRLRGSLFDDPVDVSPATAESASLPRVDLNGKGQGFVAAQTTATRTAFAAPLQNDAFLPVLPLAGAFGLDPQPVPATAEGGDGAVAWMQGSSAADASVHARFFDNGKPGIEGDVSNPAFGPVDPTGGFDAASNRAGDVVVVFVQGQGDGRRIVSGTLDRSPGAFLGTTTTHWRNRVRPVLSWGAAFELWGPVTYTVNLDGKDLGTTPTIKYTPAQPLADGLHRWRVTAMDRRGQRTVAPLRELRVDTVAPVMALSASKGRKAGQAISFRTVATDESGSGIKRVLYSFGDGSADVTATTARHAFEEGAHTVTVTVTDRAGNVTTETKKLNIRP